MLDKDPSAYPILTYLWVAGLAVIGGVISHLRKINGGAKWNLVRFSLDIGTSAFVGIITFWLCEAAELQPLVTAALIGVSGHMGSRAFFVIENALRQR